MATKRYVIFANILNLLMIDLLSILCVWYIYIFAGMPITPWVPVAFTIILMFSHFARRYIKKLLFFFLVHLVLIVGILLLRLNLIDMIMILVFAIIWTILNFVFWTQPFQRGVDFVPLPFAIVFLAAFIYGTAKQSMFLTNAAYVMGIIFVGAFFLRMYFSNIRSFSADKQMHENVPMNKMFSQNGKMVFALVTVFVLAMILLRSQMLMDGFTRLLLAIRAVIVRFIEWLLSLLPEWDFGEQYAQGTAEDITLVGGEGVNPFLRMLVEAIEKLLRFSVTVLIIWYCARGIYRFCSWYRRRYLHVQDEIFYDDVKETKAWIEREKKRRFQGLFSRLTNEEKVRRLYKKKIEALRKKGYAISGAHAPMERVQDVKLWKQMNEEQSGTEKLESLTKLYEEVRYSNHEVNHDMVKAAKEMW